MKQSKVPKATPFGNIADHEFVISQQANGFEQSHFLPQTRNGVTELLMKKPVQLALTAGELSRQLRDRDIHHLCRRQFVKHSGDTILQTHSSLTLDPSPPKFLVEHGDSGAQCFATLAQIGVGRRFRRQPLAYGGQPLRSGVYSRGAENPHDLMQEKCLRCVEKRQQLIAGDGKETKVNFIAFVGENLGAGPRVHNKQVPGRERAGMSL